MKLGVTPPLLPDACRSQASGAEASRVQLRTEPRPLGLETLRATLSKLPGPRLLVVNTVQNAAVIAEEIVNVQGRHSVEYVSTALTPEDRSKTYDRVIQRLNDRNDERWTLVATSCVEAGVDFDFASGMRERASLMSLLQISGRVNRHGQRGVGPVLDFMLAPDPMFNHHPAFEHSALVLAELFAEGRVSADFCLEALRRELNRYDVQPFLDQLRREENAKSFRTVQNLFRVFSSRTFTAVVKPELFERLRSFEPIPFRELQDGSVQLWLGKEHDFKLPEFPRLPGVFRWNLDYTPFLGYMAWVLPLLRGGQYGYQVL